ncbi:MAG: hypothetical protein R6X20_01625 [Phycisphaerae bacterium]
MRFEPKAAQTILTAGWLATALALLAVPAAGQNVIDAAAHAQSLEPVHLDAPHLGVLLGETPDFAARAKGEEADRVRAKLNAHVAAMLEGWPWKAFHNTLGISGYEAYFNHPDEAVYALAIALPQLDEEVREQARRFLAEHIENHPPYDREGYENRRGRPRERYTVPDGLRPDGHGKANGRFGVYALWAYCYWAEAPDAAKAHWEAVCKRMAPLLEKPYEFDIRKQDDTHDEAERLTADLAGLAGLARLARMAGNAETARRARTKALELLELRVNLERVNPRILEKTHSATKTLHIAKLARYCDLVPEVGRAVADLSGGMGRARLAAFRAKRNAWYLAFTERLIGGENYVSPPHMGRAMMAGATFVERLPAEDLLGFVDIPWCEGDLYFIEKCTYSLWAAAGRKWKRVE